MANIYKAVLPDHIKVVQRPGYHGTTFWFPAYWVVEVNGVAIGDAAGKVPDFKTKKAALKHALTLQQETTVATTKTECQGEGCRVQDARYADEPSGIPSCPENCPKHSGKRLCAKCIRKATQKAHPEF